MHAGPRILFSGWRSFRSSPDLRKNIVDPFWWSNRIANGTSSSSFTRNGPVIVVTSRCVYRRRRWWPNARWGITTRRFRREHPADWLAGSVKLKPRRIVIERARACLTVSRERFTVFPMPLVRGRKRFSRVLRARWSVKLAAILGRRRSDDERVTRGPPPRDNARVTMLRGCGVCDARDTIGSNDSQRRGGI